MAAYESLVLRFESQGAEQTEKSVKTLKSELTQMNNALKVMDSENRLLGASTESLTERMKMLTMMVDKNGDIMKQAETDLATYVDKQRRLGREIDENDATMRRYNGILNACATQHESLQVQLRSTENRLDSMGDEAARTGQQMESVNRVMSFGTMMGLRELGSELMTVSRHFTDFATEAYKTSKSAQASLGTVNLVFGDLAEAQIEWAESTAEHMGVYQGDLQSTSGKIMGLAKSYGMMETMFVGSTREMTMSGQDLADMSQDLTVLAYDLAAMYDLPVQQALGAVESAFKGNIGAIQDFGITIQSTMLQQKAMDLGMEKSVETMTQAEKNWLIYQVMVDSASDAQGRWKRELDDGLIPMQEFETNVTKLEAAFGDALRPTIDATMGIVNDFMNTLVELDPSIFSMIGGIGAAVVALATMTVGLGSIAMVVMTFGSAAGAVFGGVAIAVGLVATGVYTLLESLRTGESAWEIFTGLWDKALNALEDIHPALDDVAKAAAALLGVFVAFKVVTTVATGITLVSTAVTTFGGAAAAATGIGAKLVAGLMALKGGAAVATGATAAVTAATATTATGVGALVPTVGSLGAAFTALGGSAVLLPVAAVTAAVVGLGVAGFAAKKHFIDPMEMEEVAFVGAISDATEESALKLADLETEFQSLNLELSANGRKVTEESFASMMSNVEETMAIGVAGVEEKYGELETTMYNIFNLDGEITEHETAQIEALKTNKDAELKVYADTNAEIEALLTKKRDTGEALTIEENARLVELQRIQQEGALNDMVQNEEERTALLQQFNDQRGTMSETAANKLLASAKGNFEEKKGLIEEEYAVLAQDLTDKYELGDLTKEQFDSLYKENVDHHNEMLADNESFYSETKRLAWEALGDQQIYYDQETGLRKSAAEIKKIDQEIEAQEERTNKRTLLDDLLGLADKYGYDLEKINDTQYRALLGAAEVNGNEYAGKYAEKFDMMNRSAEQSMTDLTDAIYEDLSVQAEHTAGTYTDKVEEEFDGMNSRSQEQVRELRKNLDNNLAAEGEKTGDTYEQAVDKQLDSMNTNAYNSMTQLQKDLDKDMSTQGSSTVLSFRETIESGLNGLSSWISSFTLPAPKVTPPTIGVRGGTEMYDMGSYGLESPLETVDASGLADANAQTFGSALSVAPSMPTRRYGSALASTGSQQSAPSTQNYNIALNLDNVSIHNDNDINDIARKLTESMRRELFVYGSK